MIWDVYQRNLTTPDSQPVVVVIVIVVFVVWFCFFVVVLVSLFRIKQSGRGYFTQKNNEAEFMVYDWLEDTDLAVGMASVGK